MLFQKASRLKLRFQTTKGSLSSEDLWDLSKGQLTMLIKSLKEKIKVEDVEDLAFLEEGSKQVNEVDQLRFDIAKTIYIVKRDEDKEALSEADKKAHNEEILALISQMEKEELKSKSVDELKAMLK